MNVIEQLQLDLHRARIELRKAQSKHNSFKVVSCEIRILRLKDSIKVLDNCARKGQITIHDIEPITLQDEEDYYNV